MIDEKKIEEAATIASIKDTETFDCNRKGYVVSAKADHENGFREGFEAGTHWAIQEFLKGLWQDAEEEPKKDKFLLAEFEIEIFGEKVLRYDIGNICKDKNSLYLWKRIKPSLTRWLYIDDLLPKKGGSDD